MMCILKYHVREPEAFSTTNRGIIMSQQMRGYGIKQYW
jgi:hypothetical protein